VNFYVAFPSCCLKSVAGL